MKKKKIIIVGVFEKSLKNVKEEKKGNKEYTHTHKVNNEKKEN